MHYEGLDNKGRNRRWTWKPSRSSTDIEETTSVVEDPQGSSTETEGTLCVEEDNVAATVHTC